jgi:hypothetical protein
MKSPADDLLEPSAPRLERLALLLTVPRRVVMWFSTIAIVCGLIPSSAMPVAAVRRRS